MLNLSGRSAQSGAEYSDNIPMSGKTGAKIGYALAFNPITAPIATGVAIGVGTLYGTYKIVKHIVDKEDKA